MWYSARKALDDAGYTHTELSLNEWLPVPTRKTLGTATQAANICAEMLGLQRTSLDSAMIYDARCNIGIFSPLFNPFDYRPHKAYYAFKAFNELYKRKTEVKSSSSDPWRTWVVAARGDPLALPAQRADGGVGVRYQPPGSPNICSR